MVQIGQVVAENEIGLEMWANNLVIVQGRWEVMERNLVVG